VLNIWRAPHRDDIAPRVNEFLQNLPGPVAFHLPGENTKRTRVLVTLSHGNEPSGLEAVHHWLLNGRKPAMDVVVILGAVEAALAEPLFFHRQMPGKRDLNRCFNPPYKDNQGLLAQSILRHIRELQPEAVVDMHNTSGSSAAFGVTVGDSTEQRSLVNLFADRQIITDLRLGSLMEQDCGCPIVTIEAGGSLDEASEVVARQGLENYFMAEDLFVETDPSTVSTFRHPLRLELCAHSRIDYADRSLHDHDITMRWDIEQFNFVPLATHEMLGWLNGDGLSHLMIGSDYNPHQVEEFFRIEDGKFYPTRSMHLFMATTRPDIAASDCLFYFVCD
jgi:hypothetical protein